MPGPRSASLVEFDVGLHRSGVRTVPEAVDLGGLVERLPGLRLRGVLGYEGHCMLEPDRAVRIEKCRAANDALIEVVDEFDRHGLTTEIVAGGGLGTWDLTGAHPRYTEIHAGSYIFSDAFHTKLAPGFDPALTVLAHDHLEERHHGGARLRPKVDRHRPHPARGRDRRGRDPLRARRALHPRGAHRARPGARTRSSRWATASS